MLCVKLKSFDRPCGAVAGAVSRTWTFDRDDFDFTQPAADADGNKVPYSAIALRSGADANAGAVLFPTIFQIDEAEYKYTQSKKGASVKYAHELDFLLPDIGHFITQWNEKIDAAGSCCGIGLIVELFSESNYNPGEGRILVLGEKFVNGNQIRRWMIAQDGSTGTSGKLIDDSNGQQTSLKGDYFRSAYEFIGGVAAIEALEATNESSS